MLPSARTMRALLACAAVALFMGSPAGATRHSDDERELRALHAALDEAFLRGDVDLFDRTYAPEYRFSHHFGRLVSREDNLAYLRKLRTHPPYRVVKATSEDVRVRVAGDAAWVTARWIVAVVPVDEPTDDPHEDHGLYTGIYERRGGRWLLVGEHMSEAFHDPVLMKRGVEAASRRLHALLAEVPAGRDPAVVRRLIAEDSHHVMPDGSRADRAAFATIAFSLPDVRGQSLRVLDNYIVQETGTRQDRAGQRSEAYTVTWIWRDLRWQVASSQHTLVATSSGRVRR
jgi:ketosteroid isomerase-like protein